MDIPLPDRFLGWWFRRGFRGFLTLRRLHRKTGGAERLLRRTPYGSVFRLSPQSYIDSIVLREGYYESEVLEALRPYLGAGAVLWDIGGNFGLHAVTAKLLHPAATVVVFEPNPRMAEEILHHAELNHVEVLLRPEALAQSAGARTFHVNDSGNPGMSTLCAWAGGTYDRQITVPVARGDELVAAGDVPAPTVIKLDAEGGEADVIAGLGALLARPELRAIVFESHAGLARAPDSPIAAALRANGFQFAPLSRHENSDHALANYLAIRTG